MKNVRIFVAAILAMSALAMVGCNSEPADGPPPVRMTQQQLDEQIAKINADPNMDANAKQMAIGAMRSAFEQSKAAESAGQKEAEGRKAAGK